MHVYKGNARLISINVCCSQWVDCKFCEKKTTQTLTAKLLMSIKKAAKVNWNNFSSFFCKGNPEKLK